MDNFSDENILSTLGFLSQVKNNNKVLKTLEVYFKNIESIKSFNAWISFPRMSPNGKKIVFEK